MSRSAVIQHTSRRLGLLCALTLAFAFAISLAALGEFRHLGDQIYAGDDLIGRELAQRDALLALVNEETGVRAYVATGNENFLDIYLAGRRQFAADQRDIVAPAGHLGISRDELALAAAGSHDLQAYFSREIALVARGDRARATRELTLGKFALDHYRRLDADVQARILATSLRRTAATRNALSVAEELTIAKIAVLALIGIGFIPLVRRGAGFERDALSDAVTSLGNRRAFLERLEQHRSADLPFSVVLIDLDGFKDVNDTFGHATGDRVLYLVGERLRAELRADDFAARVGGDEFAVLLDGVGARDAAESIVERLCGVIERPSSGANGAVARVGASAGVCVYPEDGREAAELLECADRAMYANKNRRRVAADPAPPSGGPTSRYEPARL